MFNKQGVKMVQEYQKYTMLDEFDIPVYVTQELTIDAQTKLAYVDKRNAWNGLIRKKGNRTELDLDYQPNNGDVMISDEYPSFGVNGVDSSDDGVWYAQNWDGNLLFILTKFHRISMSEAMRAGYVTNARTKWKISEFELRDTFINSDDLTIKEVELNFDYLYQFFDFRADEKEQTIEIGTFNIKGERFSIDIKKSISTHIELDESTDIYKAVVHIEFDKSQSQKFVRNICSIVKELFEIVMDRHIRLRKIDILNDGDKEWRNAFIYQDMVLDKKINKVNPFINHPLKYSNIHHSIFNIFNIYFNDTKLRAFTKAYLATISSRMPVRARLITLTSGVDTYFIGEKRQESNTTVSSLKDKLSLLPLADADAEGIKNSRNFLIHGVQPKKFIGEEGLPDQLQKLGVAYYNRIVEDLKK